jgi:hypothetical protein
MDSYVIITEFSVNNHPYFEAIKKTNQINLLVYIKPTWIGQRPLLSPIDFLNAPSAAIPRQK